MRYLILGFIIIILIGFYWAYRTPPAVNLPIDTPSNDTSGTASQESQSQHIIAFNGKQYGYIYYRVPSNEISRVFVLNNPQQDTMRQLVKDNGCTAAINGEFYTPEGKPLGLLIHNSVIEQNANTASSLLDGYWFILDDNSFNISRALPSTEVKEALQNGPMLIENDSEQNLAIQNDEYARRSLLAKTINGELVLMTLFLSNSQLEGPLLGELPQLLTTIAEAEGISFESALNLDGGSAAGIITPEESLSEFSNVGSIVCVR